MLLKQLLPVAGERLISIAAGASLAQAARLLSRAATSLLVVHSANESLPGINTKTDFVRWMGQSEAVRASSCVCIMRGLVELYNSGGLVRYV